MNQLTVDESAHVYSTVYCLVSQLCNLNILIEIPATQTIDGSDGHWGQEWRMENGDGHWGQEYLD